MDFHLNSLLDLSQATVFTCYHETDFICLHLQLNNPSITCPNCQKHTDNLHDTSYVLVRDLSIFGNLVYLKVPRRKFYCDSCGKYPTEIIDSHKSEDIILVLKQQPEAMRASVQEEMAITCADVFSEYC